MKGGTQLSDLFKSKDFAVFHHDTHAQVLVLGLLGRLRGEAGIALCQIQLVRSQTVSMASLQDTAEPFSKAVWTGGDGGTGFRKDQRQYS